MVALLVTVGVGAGLLLLCSRLLLRVRRADAYDEGRIGYIEIRRALIGYTVIRYVAYRPRWRMDAWICLDVGRAFTKQRATVLAMKELSRNGGRGVKGPL